MDKDVHFTVIRQKHQATTHTWWSMYIYKHTTHPFVHTRHICQDDTKPGTVGTLITAMPNYQLLRRPVGEGGFLVVAIAASLLPANSLPRGKTRREVGGEVSRSRGQQFNRAVWSSGTSLAIIVRCTNRSSSQMPAHMQHFSW